MRFVGCPEKTEAVSFGLQHAHGFPRGAAGVLLAGTWALMLR